MPPALTFCIGAAMFGCLFRGVVVLRLRAARRRNVSDRDLCSLRQASRITTVAVVLSLVGIATAGMAYVLS